MKFKLLHSPLFSSWLILYNILAKQVTINEAEKVAKNFIYITLNKYEKPDFHVRYQAL